MGHLSQTERTLPIVVQDVSRLCCIAIQESAFAAVPVIFAYAAQRSADCPLRRRQQGFDTGTYFVDVIFLKADVDFTHHALSIDQISRGHPID